MRRTGPNILSHLVLGNDGPHLYRRQPMSQNWRQVIEERSLCKAIGGPWPPRGVIEAPTPLEWLPSAPVRTRNWRGKKRVLNASRCPAFGPTQTGAGGPAGRLPGDYHFRDGSRVVPATSRR